MACLPNNLINLIVLIPIIAILGLSCKSDISVNSKEDVSDEETQTETDKSNSNSSSESSEKKKSDSENAQSQANQQNAATAPISDSHSNTAAPTLEVEIADPPEFLQEREVFITLNYNQADGFEADSCTVSDLEKVTVSTPCQCTEGTCTVGITGSPNAVGEASFKYSISAGAITTPKASATIWIAPDLVDDDNTTLGFGAGAFNNAEWVSGVLIKEWSESEREFQYNAESDIFTESDPVATGLVGYWKLNGAVGDPLPGGSQEIIDHSGKSHHASASGDASFIEGILNTAADFNGGDSLYVPNHDDFDMNGTGFAILFWLKVSDANHKITLLHKMQGGSPYDGIMLFTYDGGSSASKTIRASFSGDSGANQLSATSDFDVFDGEWHHYAIVAHQTDHELYIYYDGKLASAADSIIGAAWPTIDISNSLYIADGWGIGNDVTGQMDEIMIFKRDLSQEDVQKIFQRQKYTYGGTQPAAFTSRIFDSGKDNANWNSLRWEPAAPYFKELPAGSDADSPHYNSGNTESSYENANANTDFMNSLLAYYRLNGTGSIANSQTIPDYSGNQYHGVFQDGGGANNFESGKFHDSIAFDGNDYISLDPALPFNLRSMSIAAWIYFDTDPATGDEMSIVTHYQDLAGNQDPKFRFSVSADGRLNFLINADDGAGCAGTTTYPNFGYKFAQNKWYHVALTSTHGDGSAAGTITGYINGEAVITYDYVSTLCAPLDGNLNIGRRELYDDEYFTGKIDEISIWNRPLTPPEISQLFQRGSLGAKLQIRSCSQSDCSDGAFIGPDGTSNTFYTEQQSSNSLILPRLDFSPPLFGRYFQYKLFLESENGKETPEILRVEPGIE